MTRFSGCRTHQEGCGDGRHPPRTDRLQVSRREAYSKDRADTQRALTTDRSMMGRYDRFRDGKTESSAARFTARLRCGAIETLEHMGQIVRRNPHSLIVNCDGGLILDDVEIDLNGRMRGRVLNGVFNEDEEELPQHRLVAEKGLLFPIGCFDRDLLFSSERSHDATGFIEDLVQINFVSHNLQLSCIGHGERKEALDNSAHRSKLAVQRGQSLLILQDAARLREEKLSFATQNGKRCTYFVCGVRDKELQLLND